MILARVGEKKTEMIPSLIPIRTAAMTVPGKLPRPPMITTIKAKSKGSPPMRYSYHKWINPEFLENKKQSLIELSENPETLRQAKLNIESNPDFYNGKSAQDLLEMQQENIKDILKPSKVFPISLFSFLFLGMISTLLISLLTNLFQNKT